MPRYIKKQANPNGTYFIDVRDFISRIIADEKLTITVDAVMENEDMVSQFTELMKASNESKRLNISEATVFNDVNFQSEQGKKGVVKRWEGVSEEERSRVGKLGGSAAMAKRRKEGSLSEFCSQASKIAWEKQYDLMYSNAIRALEEAGKVAYKRVNCSSCNKKVSQATLTRWHKLNKDGKCIMQLMYECLPDKFTKKEAINLFETNNIEYRPAFLRDDVRIRCVLSSNSPSVDCVYCKEHVYDEMIKEFENVKSPVQSVVDELKDLDKFSARIVKKLCEKHGVYSGTYKKILRKYCNKIYGGGKNLTSDPPMYKVKQTT